MTSRFISNLIALLAGGFLAAAALVFSSTTAGWLALGVGCLCLTTELCAFAFPGRGAPQRVLDVTIATLAAWTIVASRAFDGSVLRWLSFSGGAGLLGLALVGLLVHEVALERMVRAGTEPRVDAQAATTIFEQRRAGAL